MGWFRPANPKPGQKFKAVYRDTEGRQRSRTFQPGQKQLATRWLKEMETDVAKGDWRDPAGGRTAFKDWAEQWAAQLATRTASRRTTEYQLHKHVIPRFGRQRLGQINRLAVQEWVRDLSSSGLADESVKFLYRLLATIMAAAVDEDLIARSPCRKVHLPTRRPRRRPVILDTQQAERFITTVEPEHYRPLGPGHARDRDADR
jgi:hypothetical protein